MAKIIKSYEATQKKKSTKTDFRRFACKEVRNILSFSCSRAKDLQSKLKRPDILKPLILMILLMFFQQFSGVATLTYYAYDIMEQSGSNINEYSAVIIYGVTRLAASSLGKDDI